jgi:hypothetical protein
MRKFSILAVLCFTAFGVAALAAQALDVPSDSGQTRQTITSPGCGAAAITCADQCDEECAGRPTGSFATTTFIVGTSSTITSFTISSSGTATNNMGPATIETISAARGYVAVALTHDQNCHPVARPAEEIARDIVAQLPKNVGREVAALLSQERPAEQVAAR